MNWKKALGKKLKKKGGFTLIEMLIVVAIIAILVVVSIPVVGSSLDKARQATDDANLRAAKAAALIAYMLPETDPTITGGTSAIYYYDAADGTVAQAKDDIVGYNQKEETGDAKVEKGKGIVEVTITVETGVASAKWVPAE